MEKDDEIRTLLPEELELVKHYAELKFSYSQIATMLLLDVVAFRRQMEDPESKLARAYAAGKLLSQVKRREMLLREAEKGHEWAIRLLDQYEIKQNEEEYGCI